MKKLTMAILFTILIISPLYSAGVDGKRFRIELYGGFSMLDPADLNLRSQTDEAIYYLYHDDYYDYLVSRGGGFSYTKTRSDDFPRIKHAYSTGLRIKYHILNNFGVTLGFRYLQRNLEKEVINQISFPYAYGDYEYRDINSPYTLTIRGYVPFIGFFAEFPVKGKLKAGGFIEGGPLHAGCSFSFINYEEWYSDEDVLIEKSSVYYLEEEGSGSGIALTGGLRIALDLGRFSPFIEGSYAYQEIKELSGPGKEISGDLLEETWEGIWGIKQSTVEELWNVVTNEYPSNYWESGIAGHRDFLLDLSGFQIRMGISYRF
jgi:hypothetical protein